MRDRGWFWAAIAVWIAYEAHTCLRRITHEETYIFDWDAYMEQVAAVEDRGERNYSRIAGDTGALVYPGGHVAIHAALRRWTNWREDEWTTEYPHNLPKRELDYDWRARYPRREVRPDNVILRLQHVYWVLYVVTLVVAAALARLARVPWPLVALLAIGQRAQAVVVLGLFNDSWAVFFALCGVLAAALDWWSVATILLSVGVSVKMNILLFLPGFVAAVVARHGWRGVLTFGALGATIQVLAGLPFLTEAPLDYLRAAFDIGRRFQHRYSYNWRHVPEEVFGSSAFAAILLALQVVTLVAFVVRWAQHGWFGVLSSNSSPVSTRAAVVVRMMAISNFIGVVFARSLHYQFLVWYWFTLPVLASATRLPAALVGFLVIGLEVAWNQHPPQPWSALTISAIHLLLLAALFVCPRRNAAAA